MSDDTADIYRHDDYLKRLGIFVSAFAETEAALFLLLITTSGVSLSVGGAIFSGTRIKDAMGFVARISKVKHLPPNTKGIMESCFVQISTINDLNFLLHHGVDLTEDDLRSSGRLKAMAEERSLPVSPKILQDAWFDLAHINIAITYCIDILNQSSPQEVSPKVASAIAKAEQRSWLYKSPEQASRDNKTLESGPKQKRRPRPSRK